MKKVLVIGPRPRLDEFKTLELKNAEVSYMDQFYVDLDQIDIPFDEIEEPNDEYFMEELQVSAFDVVFDLALDDNPENFDLYNEHADLVIIGCAVKKSVGQMVYDCPYELTQKVFGLNSIPTFIGRDRFELSLYDDADAGFLSELMAELGREHEVVADRIGMVTPRIVCMIVNEACFVLQEGTAGIAEVDQAMRLGTNYPQGPFAWADAMGIHNVFDILTALKADTGEEKYKMAPLLKSYHFKDKRFTGE